jgi:hypothetical protein
VLSAETDLERLQAGDVLTEEQMHYLGKRVELLVRAEMYEDVRAALVRACTIGTPDEPGYLYFFRMMASIFEPRNPPGLQILPFIPYPYQIDELAIIHQMVSAGQGVVGKKNIKLDLKSRDMGDTWIHLGYFAWHFLFHRGSFHLGSFKEEEVDVLGSANTLFGKLRKLFYSLPAWILPKGFVDKAKLICYDGEECSITGESANEGFGRSKRCAGALLDEFQKWQYDRAALQAVSQTANAIFLVGTPLGLGNYYSEIARKKQVPGAIIRKIHWTAHPLKAKDLEIVDGKATSSWYRDQVATLPPEVVAAELDLSFETSTKGPVFAHIYGAGHQKTGLKLLPGIPVIRGWDPGGGWFAVVFLQIDRDRRVRFYREVLTHSVTLDETAAEVIRVSEELARESWKGDKSYDWQDWYQFVDVGDPSGASISKSNQTVPEYDDLFLKHSINVDYLQFATMPSEIRVRSRILQYSNAMQRHIPSPNPGLDGPALWIDIDGCPTLDEAFAGGYRRKIDANGNVMDTIDRRHPYNDVVDAGGYGIVSVLGVPEQIKREARKRSEEQDEDEYPYGEYGHSPGRRSRC